MWKINKELNNVASSFIRSSSPQKHQQLDRHGSLKRKTITGTGRATVFEMDKPDTPMDQPGQGIVSDNQPSPQPTSPENTPQDSKTPPTASSSEPLGTHSTSSSPSEDGSNPEKEILPVDANSFEPKIEQTDSESEYRAVTPIAILKQQNEQTPALRNLTDILKVFEKPGVNVIDSKPAIESGSSDLTKILKAYGKDEDSAHGKLHKELTQLKMEKIFTSDEATTKAKHHVPAIKVDYPRPKFLEFHKPLISRDNSESLVPNHPIHAENNKEFADDKVTSTRRENTARGSSNEEDSDTELHYDDLDEDPTESKLNKAKKDVEQGKEGDLAARELFKNKNKNKPMDDHMKAISAVMAQNNRISDLVKQNGIGDVNGMEPNKLPDHIIQRNQEMMKLSETLFQRKSDAEIPKEVTPYPEPKIGDNLLPSSVGEKYLAPSTLKNALPENIVEGAYIDQNKKDLTSQVLATPPLLPGYVKNFQGEAKENMDTDSFSDSPIIKIEQDKNSLIDNFAKPKQSAKKATASTDLLNKPQQQNQQAMTNQQQNSVQPQVQQYLVQQQNQLYQQKSQAFNNNQQPLQQQKVKQQKENTRKPSNLALLKKNPPGKPKGPSIAEFDSTFQAPTIKTKTKATSTGNALATSTSKATTNINGVKDSSYSQKISGLGEGIQDLRHDPPRRQGSRNSYGSGGGQGYGYGKTSYGKGGGHAWAGDNYNNYQIPNYGLPSDNGGGSNQHQGKQQSPQEESQASQNPQQPQGGNTETVAPIHNAAASAAVVSAPATGAPASNTVSMTAPAVQEAPFQTPQVPQYINKNLKPAAPKLPAKQVKIKETYKLKDEKMDIQEDEPDEDEEGEEERVLNKEPRIGKKVEQKVGNKIEQPKGKKFSGETATGSGYGTGYGNKESWGQGGGYAWAGKAPPQGAPNPADFMQKPSGMPSFPQTAGHTTGIGICKNFLSEKHKP